MPGYELLKEVRGDVIAAKKAGVNSYIVKPFNSQTLKTKIEAVFAE